MRCNILSLCDNGSYKLPYIMLQPNSCVPSVAIGHRSSAEIRLNLKCRAVNSAEPKGGVSYPELPQLSIVNCPLSIMNSEFKFSIFNFQLPQLSIVNCELSILNYILAFYIQKILTIVKKVRFQSLLTFFNVWNVCR